ncbi:MAG: sensor histidine kinase [Inquilinaceae bacterium]
MAVIITVILFLAFARRDYEQTRAGVVFQGQNLARLLSEHTASLFNSSDLVLRSAMRLAQSEAAGGSVTPTYQTHRALVGLAETAQHVGDIWIGNADGDAIVTSAAYPAPGLSAVGRSYFEAQRTEDVGLYIASLPSSQFDQRSWIVMSRRLPSADGTFEGFATVTVSPHTLYSFFGNLDVADGTVINLFTADQDVLVRRDASTDTITLGAKIGDAFAFAEGGAPPSEVTTVSSDGVERLYLVDRVGTRDVFVSVGIPTQSIQTTVVDRLAYLAVYGAAALFAILALCSIALGRARQADAARKALKTANATLEERVADRTASLEITNARLQEALGAKNAMLGEVNHRVKNSLQLISSLLNMQAHTVNDPKVQEHLTEAHHRVLTIARVHERLYQTDNVDSVEFGQYLRDLCAALANSLTSDARYCDIAVEADTVQLATDRVIPAALIVNELLTNGFKYSGIGGTATHLAVTSKLVDNGQTLQVSVVDDGPGLPPDFALDGTSRGGFGSRMMPALARQLHGELQVIRHGGSDGGSEIALILPVKA